MGKNIKCNKIKCLKCGDIIVSESTHDFKYCSCESVAVDGGNSYEKRVGNMGDWEELTEYEGDENKPTVLVDCDGVLLDMCGAIKERLAQKGIDFKPENVETYNFGGDIGCSKKEVYSALSDIETFKLQKEYSGVESALKVLDKYAKIKAYTKVGNKDDIFRYRCRQLYKLGIQGVPFVDEKPVIDGVEAVFDDCIEVLERWVDVEGVILFLIDQPYNRDLTGTKLEGRENVIRRENFREAVEIYARLKNGFYEKLLE